MLLLLLATCLLYTSEHVKARALTLAKFGSVGSYCAYMGSYYSTLRLVPPLCYTPTCVHSCVRLNFLLRPPPSLEGLRRSIIEPELIGLLVRAGTVFLVAHKVSACHTQLLTTLAWREYTKDLGGQYLVRNLLIASKLCSMEAIEFA